MSATPAVYMDACCFIDVVKFDVSARLEDGREQEVWYIKKLMQAHRDREITVYTSTISIAEASHAGSTPVPQGVQNALESLLVSGQYAFLVQADPFVCTDARNLRWNEGIALKGPDSVHLASALSADCSEFHSMDGRFERVAGYGSRIEEKGLRVCQPSQTTLLPAKYLQGDLLDGESRH
ncbi:type II toxin-antitoxin system VapC family toxin [Roseovarius confluentis]|uniref:type II toxin-antitoxin system VapC family toxin n=1 Tax=Roseovarius confluentis TaxID=1852027 RepID=UPI000CDDF30D|nr:PIN domain-containing protein [Roseovarius confluentis]